MHVYVNDGSGNKPVPKMSYAQVKQAAAIMDCIGRMIPQEGVDYDIEIIFKGAYDPSVSMNIVPHTDKGEWWRKYVMEMIKVYPPSINNPEMAIPEGEAEYVGQEADDEEVMS